MRLVHPEVDELRPKLKEILYDCAVDIRATKAALYLFDGATNRFEIVTEYGFRGGVRQSADHNDALVDRCGRGRNPFFVNGVAVEPRLSEILFEAGTDRLLAAPLYLRGQLVGLIDMRDKAAKQPFEQTDIPKAQKIGDRLLELFANKNVFGQRFISLSQAAEEGKVVNMAGESVGGAASARPATPPPGAPAAPPLGAPPVAAPDVRKPSERRSGPHVVPKDAARVPRLATLIIDARAVADRIVAAPSPDLFTESDLAAARDVLRSILLIPGSVAATFSAFGHLGGVQEIAGRAVLSEEAKSFLQSKLQVWLNKRGEAGGLLRASAQITLDPAAPPLTPNELQKVFTAPVTVGALRGLYLTVAFAGTPERASHELLAVLHGHLQLVLEQSIQRTALASLRMRIAESLVEPDFVKYKDLRRHTDAVVKLAEAFARFLALPQADVDNARIVALVHDVGMRVLDYERLYRKKDLSPDELAILREHSSVGAAMVEPVLGGDVARAVLSHHERVDGRGYPNELYGDEIPYLSRLVQLADAYVAITDPDTYQPVESSDAALAIIKRGAGAQFDAELAGRFVEMVRGRR